MSEQKSRYFGNAQSWLDEEPAEAPVIPPVLQDREELKRRVSEAAASVGYVAPSEVDKPVRAVEPKVERAVRAVKPKRVEPTPEPELKSKGRPKGDRTVQMSVRIRQEHDDLIKAIAGDDFTVASIVEAALIAFARQLAEDRKYKRMPLDGETLALAKRLFNEQAH